MLNVHSSSGALLKAKLIISFNNKLGMYLSLEFHTCKMIGSPLRLHISNGWQARAWFPGTLWLWLYAKHHTILYKGGDACPTACYHIFSDKKLSLCFNHILIKQFIKAHLQHLVLLHLMPGSFLTYAWVGLLQRTLDGGCSEFPRVLKPKIDKMGTLKKMGTQNPKKKRFPWEQWIV